VTRVSETLAVYVDGSELYDHVRTAVKQLTLRKVPAYITSDMLQRCRGANLIGSTEISHLGIGICPSRMEDKMTGISMVQLPSRRTSTTRAIYPTRSDAGFFIDHANLPSMLVAHPMRRCQRTESSRPSSTLSSLLSVW
jgi:hypothetical protein